MHDQKLVSASKVPKPAKMIGSYFTLTVTIFLVSVQQQQSVTCESQPDITEDQSVLEDYFDYHLDEYSDEEEDLQFRIAIDPIWTGESPDLHNGESAHPDIQKSNDQYFGHLPAHISSDSVDGLKAQEEHAKSNYDKDLKPKVRNPRRVGENSRIGTCTIGTNNGDLPMNQPLLVSPMTNEIVQPSKTGIVSIQSGDSVNLYCTDSFLDPFGGKKKMTVVCVEDNVFTAEGQEFNFNEFRCLSMVGNLIRKTGRTCFGGAAVVEVGYNLVDTFIHLMDICHNIQQQATHYVHYAIGPYLQGYQSGIPRPLFIPGGFFNGADVNQLYSQFQQKLTFDRILGYDTKDYFNIQADVYMARGHMAAKVDFAYAPSQWATFFYINVAPQWQAFNGGNWERLESGVRRFAGDRDLDLDVYTGNWGVMTLPDVNGEQTALYLGFDKDGHGLIPVPKIYWRIIVDKDSNLGVAFIGVNNIHATQEELDEEYIICNDVSDLIDWIPWDKKNILKGYSYACEVNDLVERIGLLPEFNITGLLV